MLALEPRVLGDQSVEQRGRVLPLSTRKFRSVDAVGNASARVTNSVWIS